MSKSEQKNASFKGNLLSLLVVLGFAILFGALVLPRFRGGLEGGPAPEIVLPVLSGGEPGSRVKLSDQRGSLVLLDFWASWCRPCREQMQILESVRQRYGNRGLVVLGVNVSDAPSAARSYLEQVKPSWVILEDVDNEASTAYQVQALPTLVAIDRAGQVFAVRRRFVPERELAAMIEAMGE